MDESPDIFLGKELVRPSMLLHDLMTDWADITVMSRLLLYSPAASTYAHVSMVSRVTAMLLACQLPATAVEEKLL